MWIHGLLSSGPASSSSTLYLPLSLSRAATQHPAEPAPATMKSYSAIANPRISLGAPLGQLSRASLGARLARRQRRDDPEAGQHGKAFEREVVISGPVAQRARQERPGRLRQHLRRQRHTADRAVMGAAEIIGPGDRQKGQDAADAKPQQRCAEKSLGGRVDRQHHYRRGA